MAEESDPPIWITPQKDARCFERQGTLLSYHGFSIPKSTTIVVHSMKVLTYDHKDKMCVGFRRADFERVWLLVEELVLTVDEIQKLAILWEKTCKAKGFSTSPFESVFFAQLQLSSGVKLQ
jgi:hypothetical protein